MAGLLDYLTRGQSAVATMRPGFASRLGAGFQSMGNGGSFLSGFASQPQGFTAQQQQPMDAIAPARGGFLSRLAGGVQQPVQDASSVNLGDYEMPRIGGADLYQTRQPGFLARLGAAVAGPFQGAPNA